MTDMTRRDVRGGRISRRTGRQARLHLGHVAARPGMISLRGFRRVPALVEYVFQHPDLRPFRR